MSDDYDRENFVKIFNLFENLKENRIQSMLLIKF